MAERHGVGISNREAPEEEARERQEHPARPEDEAGETEPQIRDGQSSTKSGAKASAQKKASTRHTEDTAPAAAKVQGRSVKNQREDSHMARAIWTGSLSFGLVNIPIKYTAVRDHRPHFRMLHAKDKSPINFERVCQKDGKTVAWQDLVKGYGIRRVGSWCSPKTISRLPPSRRRDGSMLDFVEADAIDDRYFDKPYYLTAKKGGEVAYALLREAMNEAGRIGIAKFVLRDTQHLAAVEGIGDALVLSTLRFADELVDTSSLTFPSGKNLKKAELNMATMLVENLAAEWDPAKHTDDYQENLMRVIKAKMKGKEPDLVVEERSRDSNVIDLMERLRQSLNQSGGRRGARKATQSKTRKAPARARKARGATAVVEARDCGSRIRLLGQSHKAVAITIPSPQPGRHYRRDERPRASRPCLPRKAPRIHALDSLVNQVNPSVN